MARHASMGPWLLGGAAVAVGVLALAATPTGQAAARRVERTVSDWTRNVVRLVSAREGRPDSLNRNLDGVGLSYGVIQWTQKSGNLGKLLGAMHEADPAAFARIFGPSWSRLLDVTRRGSLEPIDGAVLWAEPWASRFIAAGRHPPFVEVQWAMAAQGEHFRGAERVAALLGVRTERAMALFFDRSVQQGPGAARQLAERLLASYAAAGRRSVPYAQVLVDYAALAAARFRRTTPPPSHEFTPGSTRVVWKQVGNEWHAVTGPFDLYAVIVKRTDAILRDPSLSDAPIPAAVA